jgi:hypothetical protein
LLGLFAGVDKLKALFLLLQLPGGRGTWCLAGMLRGWARGRGSLALGGGWSLGGYRVRRGLGICGSGLRNSDQISKVLLLEGFELKQTKVKVLRNILGKQVKNQLESSRDLP